MEIITIFDSNNYIDDHESLASEEDWYEVERNLTKIIDESEFGLLLVGSVQRWDGKYDAGGIIKGFYRLQDFWRDCDIIKIYEDDDNLKISCTHHDGTNTATIKRITEAGFDYLEKHEGEESLKLIHHAMMESDKYTEPICYAKQFNLL